MENIIKLLQQIWPKYRIELFFFSLALIVSIISIIIYLTTGNIDNSLSDELEQDMQTSDLNIRSQKITIDLSGAVQKPDVYEVAAGARLKDILILAQGLSVDADRDFFARNFNLARLLKDQDKIHIPSKYEISTGIFKEPNRLVDLTQPQIVNYQKTPSLIDINKASLKELENLPGVGAVSAQKIISNRPFISTEELLSKKIINKNVYEQIKELVKTN